MAKDIRIFQYQRGNHSLFHVFNYGTEIFRGNATQAKKEIRNMIKFCKNKWYSTSTNYTMRDFVAYEMADILVIAVTKNGKIEPFFY